MGSIFTAFNVIYVSFLIIYFSMFGDLRDSWLES